jgi:hypothetical protein
MSDLESSIGYCPFTGDLFLRKKPAPQSKYPEGTVFNSLCDQGYVRFQFCGRKYRGQRVAHLLMTGNWPDDEIDHKNGDRSDNQWSNLEDVSHLENVRRGLKANKLKLKQLY